ncbi:MAG: hypothetical protein EXQ91_09545 [Alphaproteobacteria bacterium]|nr:hypothetical protein [Alphaproteobacteria bacterium]
MTIQVFHTLGVPPETLALFDYVLGLGLLLIGIEIVWRHRAPPQPNEAGNRRSPSGSAWALSALFGALWLLWVANAIAIFWLVIFVVGLPAAVGITQRSSFTSSVRRSPKMHQRMFQAFSRSAWSGACV